MENVFTTFFDLSQKGQENSVNYANCVNCVTPLNYQTLPSKNETEEREGYYESTARPVGKSRITSTRPGLNQYKTPITKMLQRVAMIFAVLVMSMANVGVVWGGDKYYLFTPSGGGPAHTGSLSGQFICAQEPTSDTKTIDEISFSHYVATTDNTSLTASWTAKPAGTATIDYDMKTNAATFTVYAYNSNGTNYGVCKAEVEEGETPTSFSQVGSSFNKSGKKISFDVTTTKNKRVRIGTNNKDNVKFYQIVVEETGTPLPQPAASTDYTLDFSKKRFSNKSGKGVASPIDGMEIVSNADTKYDGTVPKLSNGSNKHTYYIKFTTTSTCNTKLKVTASAAYSLNTVENAFATTTTASNEEVALTPNTTYWIKGNNAEITVSKIEFKVVAPTSTWKFKYSGDSYDPHTMNEAAGVASISIDLEADTRYEFGFDDNGSAFYKNGGTVLSDISGWGFNTSANNCKIHTGPAGTYTFAINTTSKEVSVTYPTVTHPNSHYAYYKNRTSWGAVYGYMYGAGDIKSAAWPGCPLASTEICGTQYYWMAADDMSGTYTHAIFNDGDQNGGVGHQTWNLPISGSGAHYNDYQDDQWYAINYSISFNAGEGTGTMSAIEGLCPGDDPELPANTFTRTGYTFNGWKTNVAITANSAAVAADGAVAAGATINDIATDITLTAQWTPIQYDVTLEKGSADAAPAGNSGSAKVLYDAAALTNITHATWTGHVLTGYYTSNTDGTKVLNADGSFAASTVSGYITDNKWTRAENTTLKAQWTCIDFTPGRGGTSDGTYTVGENGGTLTCSVAEAGSYTYQWKQYTLDQGEENAVNAVGTGATTASFTPHPTVAGTYYYFCAVTNGCGTTKNCATSGTFTFNAAAPVTGDGCWDPANDDDDELTSGDVTLTKFENNFTSVSGITSVTIESKGTESKGQCSGEDGASPSGYMKVKNVQDEGNKIITITISAVKDITIGGQKYGDNSGSFYLVKSTDESNRLAECNTGETAKASNCVAGTYYIYAKTTSDNKSINFSLLCIEDPVVPTATISATLLTPAYMATGSSGVQIGVTITGASDGWKYKVKNGSGGYENPNNTAYTTTTWTMTSTIGPGANTYVVELYDGTDTKQATSNTITVTGETTYPVTITAGANGTVSPSGIVQANGSHIKPEIRATPNSGYRFVNWTLNNSNATLADASSATTTITNATGACEITANFAAAATPIVSWDLNVNANWVDVDGTSDNASITDPETSTSNITVTTANLENKTDKLELSSDGSRYVEFTFDVACGKKLTPDSIVMQVLNVGGSSGGKMTHKAELSDNYGHKISGTVQPESDGTLTKLKVTNGGNVYFQGAVSLKVWAWNHTDTKGTAFRMGKDVDIYGAVASQTTPAATITWDTHPANGQVGDPDATIAAHASDGSTVSFTTNDADVATIVDGKVHYVGAGSTTIQASITDQCGNTVNLNSNSFTVTAVASSYSVTYNGNENTGGSVPSDATSYNAGDIVTVKGNTGSLVKTGQTFLGWSTSATASSGTFYPAGYKFEMPASNVTLYAVWGSAAEEKYYYGSITITTGALTPGSTG